MNRTGKRVALVLAALAVAGGAFWLWTVRRPVAVAASGALAASVAPATGAAPAGGEMVGPWTSTNDLVAERMSDQVYLAKLKTLIQERDAKAVAFSETVAKMQAIEARVGTNSPVLERLRGELAALEGRLAAKEEEKRQIVPARDDPAWQQLNARLAAIRQAPPSATNAETVVKIGQAMKLLESRVITNNPAMLSAEREIASLRTEIAAKQAELAAAWPARQDPAWRELDVKREEAAKAIEEIRAQGQKMIHDRMVAQYDALGEQRKKWEAAMVKSGKRIRPLVPERPGGPLNTNLMTQTAWLKNHPMIVSPSRPVRPAVVTNAAETATL